MERIFPAGMGTKIGVLGGTFDPVHNGHLVAATTVRDCLKLDSVLFVPAAKPPHKTETTLSDYKDRVAMLNIALSGQRGLFVSEIENERAVPSYTVDTLKIFRNELPSEVMLYFVVGFDAFMELETWKEYDQLLHYAHLVVLERPAIFSEGFEKKREELFPGYKKDPQENKWCKDGMAGCIYHVRMPPAPISSTEIRSAIRHGRSIETAVPSAVYQYIQHHHLYV